MRRRLRDGLMPLQARNLLKSNDDMLQAVQRHLPYPGQMSDVVAIQKRREWLREWIVNRGLADGVIGAA